MAAAEQKLQPASVVPAETASDGQPVDGEEDHRPDNGGDETRTSARRSVQADEPAQEAAEVRTTETQEQGHDDSTRILAGHDELREATRNETDEEHPQGVHAIWRCAGSVPPARSGSGSARSRLRGTSLASILAEVPRMAANLMDSARELITPQIVGTAAEDTGESPDNMRRAMHGAVPTILAGLTHHASTPGGASRMLGMFSAGDTRELAGHGQGLVSKLFGDRTGAVSDTLARSSGIKSGSASRALAIAAPIVVGVLGKDVSSRGLNEGGLTQLLQGHKQAIVDDPHTPDGLADAMGVDHPLAIRAPASHRERDVQGPGGVRKLPRWAIALPLLLLGALAVWGISALTQGNRPRPGVTAPQPEAPRPNTQETQQPATEAITLPGGHTLHVERKGPEADFARYLGDSSAPLPHTFPFDGLTFESGLAELTPDSSKTIDDLAAMLQAYQSARVRVEGHTDSRGTPEDNRTLGAWRAAVIKHGLQTRGVAADRIETAGKSDEGPVADNDSEEGRARNRRAEIVLLSR
jgi:outer membrane protein OmpA-like peptidoglycan-associated protein